MRKNMLIGALGMMAMLLSACSMENTENREEIVVVEEIAPTIVPADTDEKEMAADSPAGDEKEENVKTEEDSVLPDAEPEEQSSVSDESPDTYRELYMQVVTETEGDAVIFSLVYLDNDDIPELVVCDRGYGIYSIYTVKNGKAFCMVDAMTTVEMTYFERKGVISQFARWNGGGDEGGYGWYYYQVSTDKALADGDLPTLHFTYDATYDEEGNWTGEGVTKYYHMDQEIDEVAYQQMMNDLGIVEGKENVLTDNALGKAEMLDQLG
ncbi:MAG: hypothetical protein HDR71_07915 [Lachnospiraceae bacterium]|nr:hypothetical protein [Lachnospiraceae bacterium]